MDWLGIAQIAFGALIGGAGVYWRYKSRIDFERHEVFRRRLDALDEILRRHADLLVEYEVFIQHAQESESPHDVENELQTLSENLRIFDRAMWANLHLVPDSVANILISDRQISLQRTLAEFDRRGASPQERFEQTWRSELVWHRDLVNAVRQELSLDQLHEETRRIIGEM